MPSKSPCLTSNAENPVKSIFNSHPLNSRDIYIYITTLVLFLLLNYIGLEESEQFCGFDLSYYSYTEIYLFGYHFMILLYKKLFCINSHVIQ